MRKIKEVLRLKEGVDEKFRGNQANEMTVLEQKKIAGPPGFVRRFVRRYYPKWDLIRRNNV